MKNTAASAVVKNEPVVLPKTHAVQPREGLYAIAKKYQVSVQQLRQWNNLTTDYLKIGQQLIVSE
jgi:LysM repeat protein